MEMVWTIPICSMHHTGPGGGGRGQEGLPGRDHVEGLGRDFSEAHEVLHINHYVNDGNYSTLLWGTDLFPSF